MVKIGKKELVKSLTFTVPTDEEAQLDVELPGPPAWKAKFKVVFRNGEKGASPTWKATWGQNDDVMVECVGWENSMLATSMPAPGLIAHVENHEVGFFIVHLMCGPGLHHVNFQIFWGERYGI